MRETVFTLDSYKSFLCHSRVKSSGEAVKTNRKRDLAIILAPNIENGKLSVWRVQSNVYLKNRKIEKLKL